MNSLHFPLRWHVDWSAAEKETTYTSVIWPAEILPDKNFLGFNNVRNCSQQSALQLDSMMHKLSPVTVWWSNVHWYVMPSVFFNLPSLEHETLSWKTLCNLNCACLRSRKHLEHASGNIKGVLTKLHHSLQEFHMYVIYIYMHRLRIH